MHEDFTLIDGDRTVTVRGHLEGETVRLDAQSCRVALGWELKPEGLCRGATCVPVRDPAALRSKAGLDLEALAALLERPVAIDLDERTAVLGASAAERARALASGQAPDFTLPDLEGRAHSLAGQRGKKVLLIAYASW